MLQERVLHLYDSISSNSVAPIIAELIRLNMEDTDKNPNIRAPIHLFINSVGGNMYDAFALLSVMDSSKTPIYTYCYGYAMSAGLTIFIGGHKRFAGKYASFMIHQPTEELGKEKLFVLENRLEEVNRIKNIRTKYICQRTGLTEKDFEEHKYIDLFMDAQTAIINRIAHEIV